MIQKLRLKQVSHWDETVCLRINSASQFRWVKALFQVVSRLGDGIFWYASMVLLLGWFGKSAVLPVLHMIISGLFCTLIYKWLKVKTLRPRPYQINSKILLGANPLDQFSFPSGHTLHAVAFTTVILGYYPFLAWVVVPFTALVALSRLVLGLHYPSDVLAGAFIGTMVAGLSFQLL